MNGPGLRVAIVGCGLIGDKRAAALRSHDELVGATDPVSRRADALVQRYGGRACSTIDELLALEPDVVIVATTHDQLTPMAELALWRSAPTCLWRSRRGWARLTWSG